MRFTPTRCAALLLTVVGLCTATAGGAAEATQAATVQVQAFTPQGTVRAPRQVSARFTAPMVALGDTGQNEPFTNDCPVKGAGHWVDPSTWVLDFERPLPPGLRCSFTLQPGLRASDGSSVGGPQVFTVTTSAPMVVGTLPQATQWNGIDEEQVFLLRLDAQVTGAALQQATRCLVKDVGEAQPVQVLEGEAREAVLRNRRALGWEYLRLLGSEEQPLEALPQGNALTQLEQTLQVLRCQRPLPPEGEVTLRINGALLPSAAPTTQGLTFSVRRAFTARVECERSNANAGCLPLRPVVVSFTSTVPAQWADAIRLVGSDGRELRPVPGDGGPQGGRDTVVFAGPFTPRTTLRVMLPEGLRDDAGRVLVNAARFPLTLAVDELPPLVKFAADFGILEAREGGVLPVTLRNVEPALQARQAQFPARVLQLTQDPRRIIQWLKRVEAAAARRGEVDRKSGKWTERTGDRSVFAADEPTRTLKLAQSAGSRAFEVVGIPLRERGFYVVEVESRVLGQALLGRDQPRFVATAALVSDLAVHFKWGRESSLVWVTRLSDGQPVAGAAVTLTGWCDGAALWQGQTGKDGIAQVPQSLGTPTSGTWCGPQSPREGQAVLVSARTADDLGFALSSWSEGINPYQFQLPVAGAEHNTLAHTVTDRSLLHPGERLSMKHFLRTTSGAGLTVPPGVAQRHEVKLVHAGSGDAIRLAVDFDAGGIGVSQWQVPAQARLGNYQIFIETGGQSLYSGSVNIEQFRLPLMRASVSGSATPLVAARSAQLDLQVAYLSGGGAGGLPVKLRSLIQPAPASFRDLPDYQFGGAPVAEGSFNDDDTPSPDAEQAGAPLTRVQPLTLDASGALRTRVDELPAVQLPSHLVAELEYADPNGELLTTRTRITLLPAALHVGIKPQQWASSRGPLRFTVAVRDTAGAPVAGRPVQVQLYHSQRYSFRKRLVGGFYAYQTTRETHRIEPRCQGTTDARGLLACEVNANVTGEVLLRAEALDDAGHRAGATASMWVFQGEEAWFGGTSGDRMDLLPERPAWEAGERMRLQVRSPFRQATALVTVERQGVLSAFVTHLDGRDPVVEVPALASHAPNVFVSVLAVRGRVPTSRPAVAGELTALVDLNKPAMRLGMAAVKVGWKPHALQVAVNPTQSVWKVRERVPVSIKVTRSDGTPPPAGAEVAVAAVDAALLELAPNDSWSLLDAMMRERGIEVYTASALQQVVGRRHYGRKAVASGGGGGRERGREQFDSLLLWQPRVKLDGEGRATVTVPLNDSLSEFRIVAIANAGSGLFGTGSATLNTTQDLMVLSGLPPMVREGDQVLATVTVRNTSQRRIVAQLGGTQQGEGSGGAPQPLAAQTVDLAAGQSRNIAWRVTVPVGATTVRWDIGAREAGGATLDQLRVTQTVREAVPVRVQQSVLQQLDGNTSLPVALPPRALAGKGGVELLLQARLADSLGGVQDYLRRYPYDCLEQRVSRAIGRGDRAAWDTVMASLGSYIDRDGLLRFFPTDHLPGDDALTAYVLNIAAEAQWPVPDELRQRLRDGLLHFVQGKVQRSSALATADLAVRKLAALAALSQGGAVEPTLLDSVVIEPAQWPTSALLDFIDLLHRVPDLPQSAARKAQALQVLRSRLDLGGTTLRLSTEARDAMPWLMVSGDSNASRLLLTALSQPAWRDDVPRLVRAVLARQRDGHWNTTVANAWGAVALARFSSAFETTPVTGRSTATLGTQSASVDWQPGTAVPAKRLGWPARPATLQLAHTGTGKPWVTLTATAAVPRTSALSAGFGLRRTVTAVEQRTPGRWSRGDLLRVRLELEARADQTWVVVDDPIPAGASILGGQALQDSAAPARSGRAWLAFEERRFEGLRAFYRYVPRGTWTVEYTLRLNNPGLFQLPASRVEAMYAPEQFAELPLAALRVEP